MRTITEIIIHCSATKEGLKTLVEQLKNDYPNATIHGHNEFAPKACPCFDVRAEF